MRQQQRCQPVIRRAVCSACRAATATTCCLPKRHVEPVRKRTALRVSAVGRRRVHTLGSSGYSCLKTMPCAIVLGKTPLQAAKRPNSAPCLRWKKRIVGKTNHLNLVLFIGAMVCSGSAARWSDSSSIDFLITRRRMTPHIALNIDTTSTSHSLSLHATASVSCRGVQW